LIEVYNGETEMNPDEKGEMTESVPFMKNKGSCCGVSPLTARCSKPAKSNDDVLKDVMDLVKDIKRDLKK
jgi:hypothetical protein